MKQLNMMGQKMEKRQDPSSANICVFLSQSSILRTLCQSRVRYGIWIQTSAMNNHVLVIVTVHPLMRSIRKEIKRNIHGCGQLGSCSLAVFEKQLVVAWLYYCTKNVVLIELTDDFAMELYNAAYLEAILGQSTGTLVATNYCCQAYSVLY